VQCATTLLGTECRNIWERGYVCPDELILLIILQRIRKNSHVDNGDSGCLTLREIRGKSREFNLLGKLGKSEEKDGNIQKIR